MSYRDLSQAVANTRFVYRARLVYISLMTKSMNKADIAKLLRQTEETCKAQGVRFTDSRQHVLEIIAAAKKPR